MAPTSLHIAQTSSEAKKKHKQNGLGLPARQQKRLERAHELDIRATRLREAEARRKAAKKKRETKVEKEKDMREHLGIGLATQLIGYSHTQAQLKNGMEAFLGLKKRTEVEQRRRDMGRSNKLEDIACEIEKEPCDYDDNADCIAQDLPLANTSFGDSFVDDDLDDDTLLEAQNLAMSNPIETLSPLVPALAPAPPLPLPIPPPRPASTAPVKHDPSFARLHGPIDRAIERILEKIPAPLIEFLSQDISLKLPDWDPASSLLYKLNRPDLPLHRLRFKVGSIVTLLRDLNTSSPLSKSQHLRILRAENDRLECLVLDGQLQGTNAILTRVAFSANYRDDRHYPFQRTQFPIRISTDFTPPKVLRDVSSSLEVTQPLEQQCQVEPLSLPKGQTLPMQKAQSQVKTGSSFRFSGLRATDLGTYNLSKSLSPCQPKTAVIPHTIDAWDDFLDSSTQIAREICSEVPIHSMPPRLITAAPASNAHCISLRSRSDLDISPDDITEAVLAGRNDSLVGNKTVASVCAKNLSLMLVPVANSSGHTYGLHPPTCLLQQPGPEKTSFRFRPKPQLQQPNVNGASSNFAEFTPSQKPPSVSDRPGLKRSASTAPIKSQIPATKRICAQQSRLDTVSKPLTSPEHFNASDSFGISTQEAASFFVDDDDISFGSPPVAV